MHYDSVLGVHISEYDRGGHVGATRHNNRDAPWVLPVDEVYRIPRQIK